MDNNKTYLPVLKSRRAEIQSLRNLKLNEKKCIYPLIQVVHKYKQFENPDGTRGRYERPQKEVLIETINSVKNLASFSKVFIDPRPLYSSNSNETLIIINRASATLFGTNIVPVLTVSDIQEVNYDDEALAFINTQGICLRVFKEDLTEDFWEKVNLFLDKIKAERGSTDFVLDYKTTDTTNTTSTIEQLKKCEIGTWRSFHFVSGCFPPDLMAYTTPATYRLAREDLQLWQSLTTSLANGDKPSFGDYAIQHPIYSPPILNSNPSRSAIYAKENEWIIMKGQNDKAKNSSKTRQYWAHANLLIEQGLLYGEACCKGDLHVIRVNNNPNGNMGGFSTWLQMGLTHHMSLTLRQLLST